MHSQLTDFINNWLTQRYTPWNFIIEQRENWMNEWTHAVLLLSLELLPTGKNFFLTQCIALPAKDVKFDCTPLATSWGRIYWIRTDKFHLLLWNSFGCRIPNSFSSQVVFSRCARYPLALPANVPHLPFRFSGHRSRACPLHVLSWCTGYRLLWLNLSTKVVKFRKWLVKLGFKWDANSGDPLFNLDLQLSWVDPESHSPIQ